MKAIVSKESLEANLNPPGTIVDFGPVVTDAAMRINKEKTALTVLPIPHGQRFNITLRLNKIQGGPTKVTKVTALDRNKKELGRVDFKDDAGEVTFPGTYADAWYYRVE
jgi:hypothetical protein